MPAATPSSPTSTSVPVPGVPLGARIAGTPEFNALGSSEPAPRRTQCQLTSGHAWYRLACRWPIVRGAPIISSMRREEVIRALRGYLAALRRDFGVRRIALFGSTARGDDREDSDLDILVEFETGPTFLSFMGLKFFLEDHLGR